MGHGRFFLGNPERVKECVRYKMKEVSKEPEKSKVSHKITNIVGIILCVVFIPLILINCVLIVRSYMDKDHIPSVFGIAPVIVLSGSMYPEFDVGDMIFIRKTDAAALQAGDVICYIPEESETAITHRIKEIQQQDGETLFITQGDANNAEDRVPVTVDSVQGKYIGFHIAGLGNLAVFLQSPLGMILFIGVPVVLFFLWDLLWKAIASKKQRGETRQLQEELERLRAEVGRKDGAEPPSEA